MRIFKVDWVLVDELAIGPAPRSLKDLDLLKKENIQGILSLCSVEEAKPPIGIEENFICRRYVLPDHRSGRAPKNFELEKAFLELTKLMENGPTFVHCVAAVERSPLLCLTWLIRKKGLELDMAMEYLMRVHPGTNPLPEQLKLLRS